MTEKQLHESVTDYINLQYPGTRFKTDLSGIYLAGKWSLLRFVKRTTSHPGFPDLIIYESKGYYCGLALELKVTSPFLKDGITLKKGEHLCKQNEWLMHLGSIGFKTGFVVGFDHAKEVIDYYLKLPR